MQAETKAQGFEVLRAVENYIKGKKSVRHYDDGKERFDNALDALAILRNTIPGMKDYIDLLVERINKVRKAEDPKHENHVDLKKYGKKRAENAKRKRAIKDQKMEDKSADGKLRL